MADQIRRRAARARAGVAMAVLALVGGAASDGTSVAAAKTISWLNLKGFTGGVRTAFRKVEAKIESADTALARFETKVERTYLTIADASNKFLKTTDAASRYLTISDAVAKFLKADGTAANSSALGGLTRDQFVQGHGAVITGEAVANAVGQSAPLMGDGSVRILIGLLPAGQPAATLVNDSTQALDFTVSGGGTGGTIKPAGGTATVPLNGQLDVQLFPSAGAGTVRTLTISEVSSPSGFNVVGQMLLGN